MHLHVFFLWKKCHTEVIAISYWSILLSYMFCIILALCHTDMTCHYNITPTDLVLKNYSSVTYPHKISGLMVWVNSYNGTEKANEWKIWSIYIDCKQYHYFPAYDMSHFSKKWQFTLLALYKARPTEDRVTRHPYRVGELILGIGELHICRRIIEVRIGYQHIEA